MQTDFGLSARRADRVLGVSHSARHYRSRAPDDGPLIDAMQAHLKDNPGYGFGCSSARR
jgi:putative transposase